MSAMPLSPGMIFFLLIIVPPVSKTLLLLPERCSRGHVLGMGHERQARRGHEVKGKGHGRRHQRQRPRQGQAMPVRGMATGRWGRRARAGRRGVAVCSMHARHARRQRDRGGEAVRYEERGGNHAGERRDDRCKVAVAANGR